MKTAVAIRFSPTKRFLGANLVRLALVSSIALFTVSQAAAQYGGGGGGTMGSGTGGGTYVAPKGGYSSAATGAGIGAGAAAGAGILFLVLHNRGRVTGCVEPGGDGLHLIADKKNTTYALLPGDVLVKPGQHVELKGHKSKDDAGAQTFAAKKLVKDLGSCSAAASSDASGTTSSSKN